MSDGRIDRDDLRVMAMLVTPMLVAGMGAVLLAAATTSTPGGWPRPEAFAGVVLAMVSAMAAAGQIIPRIGEPER